MRHARFETTCLILRFYLLQMMSLMPRLVSTFTVDFLRWEGALLSTLFVRLFPPMGKTRSFLLLKRSTTSTTSDSCFETLLRLVVAQ